MSGKREVPDPETSSKGLFQWLADAATEDGDRDVLIGLEGGKPTTLTLSQLVSKSQSLATGLLSIGVTEGSTIALWLPNQIEWMVAQFACSALGVTVLGMNTRYRSYEITHLLATVPIAAVVLPSEFLNIDFVGTLTEAVGNRLDVDSSFKVPVLVFLDDVPADARDVTSNCVRYHDLVTMEEFTDSQDHGSALSNLFTTSGSTSAPKVAGHDQTSIVRHAIAGARALGVRRSDRILAALPLCGVFGFNSVMAVLIGGGSALLLESFDAAVAARHLCESGITHIVGGDEMLGAMFAKVPDHIALPALRRGGIANFAGRAKEIVELADERWGASISGVYGSSELFALSAIWPETADVSLRSLQGGVLVEPGIEVRVVNIETGELISSGESGELQFRGYNVIHGYLNNSNATQGAFTSDGWFRTGDLGYISFGGFVYQCRAREALRLRGFLVEPGEIEEFMMLDASIDEVHVVGVDTGTKAFAFVHPRQGFSIDEAALLANAKKHLAGFKVPERVIEVSEFPTTTGTNGTKVRFEALRELALEILSSAVDH
jgi:acyl-CoA synthetase (AMP-forming)/AMP-acid ligase II